MKKWVSGPKTYSSVWFSNTLEDWSFGNGKMQLTEES